MKTVAPDDRPREKLRRLGVSALGDNELLAIVLGHGRAHASALDLANAVLSAVGGVRGFVRASPSDLEQVDGIGEARAAQLLAAVELGRRTMIRAARERLQLKSPRSVAEFLLPQYGHQLVEQFGVVLLDTKLRVLRTTILSVGTVNTSVVHPREIFREAASAGATGLVLFHNHPSGDPTPSPEDTELTRRIVAAGALMGIDVLDHVILADEHYYSFKEKGTG
jgi:DNA repair protein RadC